MMTPAVFRIVDTTGRVHHSGLTSAQCDSFMSLMLAGGQIPGLRSERMDAPVPTPTETPAPHIVERMSATANPLPEIEPQRLQEVLNELPEEFRTPLILFYFEEFSYRDIAEQMEVPLGTVMSRLARAKAHLRSRLIPAAPVAADGPRRARDGL